MDESNTTMRCPYCSETIYASAAKCRFCGEWLKNPEEHYDYCYLRKKVYEEKPHGFLKRKRKLYICYEAHRASPNAVLYHTPSLEYGTVHASEVTITNPDADDQLQNELRSYLLSLGWQVVDAAAAKPVQFRRVREAD